jgi:hypothetical protein
MNTFSKFVLITLSLFCSMSAVAETSRCEGSWENGQPVHVVIDWNKGTVNVNGVLTKIAGAVESQGIYTFPHTNRFGHSVNFAVINSTDNYMYNANDGRYLYRSNKAGTFVMQIDLSTKTANTSHGLNCYQSFTKPFMARMI